MNNSELSAFENLIHYTFTDKKKLHIALTHSSYANEFKKNTASNERQEFLGDAVLSLIVSSYLFHRFHLAEGELTKLRAALVCEKSLCEFANKISLGEYILLGKGEEMTGGRMRPSILSDAFEAVIAAIFLDGGIDSASEFVLGFVKQAIQGEEDFAFNDYKTMLQEIIQKNPEERVVYVLTDEAGPEHSKFFSVEVRLNSNVIGRGRGKSKKESEQMAAKEALELMGQ